MIVVDQRMIQKRGGACARAPVSCLLWDMVSRHIDVSRAVFFDATYGQGRFYMAWPVRPRVLDGADVYRLDWVVEPDTFILAPVWASWKKAPRDTMVYVLDPPWMTHRRGTERRPHFGSRYWFGKPEFILEQGFMAAGKIGSDYLLVHWKNKPSIPMDYRVIEEYYFDFWARYINKKADARSYFALLKRNGGPR